MLGKWIYFKDLLLTLRDKFRYVMKYPFKDVIPKIYPNTFLKDVSLSVTCPDAAAEMQVINHKDFFKKHFGISDIKQDDDGNVRIVSQDQKIVFLFGTQFVSVKIKYPVYRSFRQIMGWVDVLSEYLSIINARGHAASVTIAKFNELQYELNKGEKGGVLEVMRGVFSKDLLSFPDGKEYLKSEMFEDISRWERKIMLSDSKSASKVNVVYGFSKDEQFHMNANRRGSLTLRSDINFITDNIGTLKFKECLADKYNRILDNAFHWCVTPGIIEAMENK